MRSFVFVLLTVVLCACATQQVPLQHGGLQNAVYVVGDNGPLHAVPAVEAKNAATDSEPSALRRFYLFFVRR